VTKTDKSRTEIYPNHWTSSVSKLRPIFAGFLQCLDTVGWATGRVPGL